MDLHELPLDASSQMLSCAAASVALQPWPVAGDVSDGAGPDARVTHDSEPLVMLPATGRVCALPAYRMAGLPYTHAQVWVRAGTAVALQRACGLLPDEFGLMVLDAWRTLALQDHLAADPALVADGFVSPPSADPALAPPHTTGGTVDVTLTWRGVPLALGTTYDEFTDRAHLHALQDATEGPDGSADRLRRLLAAVMDAAGFVAYAPEWWHFERGTRRWSALRGCPPMYGPATPPITAGCTRG